MRTISDLAILLKIPEDELVRTLLRLAEEDVRVLAMAAGRRLDRIAAKG
jgi:hypothetical protein